MKRQYIFLLAVICVALGATGRQLWPSVTRLFSLEPMTIVTPADLRREGGEYSKQSAAIAHGIENICGKDWSDNFDPEQLQRLSGEWSREASKLKLLNVSARREGPILTIETAKGERRFIDGYYLCLDTAAYHYRYRQYLSKSAVHILDISAYEDGETFLVFKASGKIIGGLYAVATASPSEARVASYQSLGSWEGGLAIARIEHGEYRLEARWLLTDVQNFEWIDDTSVRATLCPQSECRSITLTYGNGKWSDSSGFVSE